MCRIRPNAPPVAKRLECASPLALWLRRFQNRGRVSRSWAAAKEKRQETAAGATPDPCSAGQTLRAFTLLELLIVLAIIGILAAISLPAMKGIGESNIIASANRQLLDDFALARQQAINGRSVVHVVFVPPLNQLAGNNPENTPRDQKMWDRLQTAPYTTYALYAERSVGDQPGQPHPRFLTSWRSLPDGALFAPWEFDPSVPGSFTYTNGIRFPTLDDMDYPMTFLPAITFQPDGNLAGLRDEVVHLSRGSVLSGRDSGGNVIFDVIERPPGNSTNNFNRIRINGLTGRATIERPEIQ